MTIGSAQKISQDKRGLLEKYLRDRFSQPGSSDRTIKPRPGGEVSPLSLAQEQLWLRSQQPDIEPLYNEAITLRRRGAFDISLLEHCITEVVRRHEIWRTTYETFAGKPVQIIHQPYPVSMRVIDLRTATRAQQEGETARLAEEQAREPFDLKNGPLVRLCLVIAADHDHRLLMTAHLSVVDGVSVYQLLPRELAKLYEAFSRRTSLPAAPSIQFADYAYWQRELLNAGEFNSQLEFWRKKLSGELPVLEWPGGQSHPDVETFRGAIEQFAYGEQVLQRLKSLCQREGVTTYTALQAAFVAVLYMYTKQKDIIIGTFSPAGRKLPEVQALLGHFINPVALRFALGDDMQFSDLLRQCQTVTSEAISHDDLPMEMLANEIPHRPGLRRNPFFSVAMSLQPKADTDSEWLVTSMDANSGGAFWDLYTAFIEQSTGIAGRVQYNPELFEKSVIRKFIDDIQSVLLAAAGNPAQPLANISSTAISTIREDNAEA